MKKQGIISRLIVGACACVLAAGLFGCASGSNTEEATDAVESAKATGETPQVVKIGTSQNSQKLAESGKEALEEMGYEVEITVFDDFQTPNRALDEGQINANIYQHVPFMEDFNESNGTDLVMLEPVLWNYFTGLYSDTYKSIDEIPEGGLIGMAPEASNISLEFECMRDWGLIELSDTPSDGEMYTELDITSNPKNLTFAYVDDTQRYANSDEYAAFIGASDGLYQRGFDPNERLIIQQTDDKWAIGMCVNASDKDSQLAKDLMTAYMSESARNYVATEMMGAFIPATED